MPNIAAVLKEEILRLARKEIRKQTSVLRKISAQYRKDIAEMKRRVSDLQRKVIPLEKQVLKNVPSEVTEVDAQRVRFTARGLRSQRRRLGLSAAQVPTGTHRVSSSHGQERGPGLSGAIGWQEPQEVEIVGSPACSMMMFPEDLAHVWAWVRLQPGS